jgi:hypothetical protein
MMAGTKLFTRRSEGEWTDVGGGNRRRVLLHTDELMMVEFAFEEGGVARRTRIRMCRRAMWRKGASR